MSPSKSTPPLVPSKSSIINNTSKNILELIKKRFNGWVRLDRAQDLIGFDEKEHRYTLNGKQNDISVTGILSKWFPFDSEEISEKCVRSKKYSNHVVTDSTTGRVDVKRSAENIRKEWADRAAAGTLLHKTLETYLITKFEHRTSDMIVLESLLNELETYLETKEFVLYKTEVKVFIEYAFKNPIDPGAGAQQDGVSSSTTNANDGRRLTVAGSIDALYCNNYGEAIIVDWKRSIARFDAFNNYGVGPMCKYPNSNFWKYSAQLNMYALILQKKYNIPTVGKILVFFEDDELHTPPRIVHVPDMPELEEYLIC